MATTSSTSSTNLGVGSGLDLTTLLKNLRTAEETKLTPITNQKTQQTARLNAYSQIQSAVEKLQTSVTALQKEGLFQSTAATTTSSAFTATTTSSAATGNYSVSVTQLAQAQSIYTSGKLSAGSTESAQRTTEFGSGGTVSFTFGSGDAQTTKTLTLDGTVTLQSLASAINADSDLGVSATLINSDQGVRLMLTSTATGTNAAINGISVADNSALQDLIGYSTTETGNLAVGTTAKNAELSINGIAVVSQSNTVVNVVDGVTITLTATTDTAATLAVAQDTAAMTKAVQDFVTAYNSVQSVIKQATAFDVAAETQAALTGDYTARSIANKFKQALQATGAGSVVQSLADLGITTEVLDANKKGLLTVDTTKLTAALKNQPSDVAKLFQGEDGIASKMSSTATTMLAKGGLFDNLEDSINATTKRLDKQYEATSARIETQMAIYQARFVALDKLVAQMSSLSTYLTSQFSSTSSSS